MKRPPLFVSLVLLALAALAAWWLTRPAPEGLVAEAVEVAQETATPAPAPKAGGDPAKLPDSQLASLSGTISGPEGQPVEGAKACVLYAEREARAWLGGRPRCVDAKADGSYRIEKVVPGRVRLQAQAPGHIAQKYLVREDRGRRYTQLTVPAGAELLDLDIELEGGGVKLEGFVEDLSGGVIEGAFVQSQVAWGGPDDASPLSVTNAEGRFELWVRAGDLSVWAEAEGYNRRAKSTVAPGSTPRIRLTPESAIEGIVVDAATQKPLEGLLIGANGRVPGSELPTRSGPDGRFRIDQLAPGRYEVSATGPQHFGMTSAVQLNFASTTEVRIEAHPAATIEGTVMVGDSDKGCEGANVTIADKSIKRYHMLRTDATGWGRVEGVLPGTYQVQVSCRGYLAPQNSTEIVVTAGEAVPEQSWVVGEGKRLHGVVVDEADQPVKDVFVRALAESESGGRGINKRTRVEKADGSWELFGLPVGKVEVSVSRSAFSSVPEKVEVELPEQGEAEAIRLVAAGVGSIRGSVRDAKGEPVAGATVRAKTSVRASSNTNTNDAGEFFLTKVAAGEVRVTAMRGGKTLRAPGTHDDDAQGALVNVSSGEEAQVELVVAATDGYISGRVLDADGAPVADAFVSATRMNDSRAAARSANKRVARSRWGEWRNEPTLTDAEGRFRAEGLSEGRYVLRAYHKEGGDALVEDVELGSDVELQIPRLGRVVGVAMVPGGDPPTSFDATLIDESAGRRIRSRFYKTSGNFTFEGVDAGEYDIVVSSSTGDAKVEGVRVGEGESVEGLVVELERKVTLSGRVVDDETGEPIAGIQGSAGVESWPSWGGLSGADAPDVSGKDGRFVIADTQGKALYLRLVPLNWNKSDYSWTSVRLNIPEGAIEHDVGEIGLMKSRLKKGESAGDLGFKTKQADSDDERADAPLEVAVVTPGGSAEQGGMKVGDVIVQVDGKDVTGERKRYYGTLTSVSPGIKLVFALADGRSITVVAGPAAGR